MISAHNPIWLGRDPDRCHTLALTGKGQAMAARIGSPHVILAAFAAVVLWGASSVATKFAVTTLSPLLVALLRTSLAGAAALPLVLALRLPPPREAGHRRGVALLAISGFVAFPVLFSLGQALTSAVHGAMLLAVLPVATGAIALGWDRRWPSFKWWLGCGIAVAGEVVLALGRPSPGGAASSLAGNALVLLSVLFGALGNVTGGRLQQAGYPAKAATLWSAVFATVLLCPVWAWAVSDVPWQHVTPAAWAGVVYLAFGVTILGYTLWYWALGRGGIARVGLLQFLQPVSGVFLAWLLLDERLTGSALLAAAIILLGVGIATRRTPRLREYG